MMDTSVNKTGGNVEQKSGFLIYPDVFENFKKNLWYENQRFRKYSLVDFCYICFRRDKEFLKLYFYLFFYCRNRWGSISVFTRAG